MPSEGQTYSVNRSSRSASDAALKGASLAFAKKPPPKPTKPDTYSGRNGALAAAMKVNPSSNRLQLPNEQAQIQLQPQSQSLLAANIAASRSPSVSPRHTGPQDPRPRTPFKTISKRHSTSALSRDSSASSAASLARGPLEEVPLSYVLKKGDPKPTLHSQKQDERPDNHPSPSTNALVGMFEKKSLKRSESQDLRVNVLNSDSRKRTPPEIKSPKPIRLSGTFRQGEHLIKTSPSSSVDVSKPEIPNIEATDRDAAWRSKGSQEDDHSSDDSFVSASDYQETVHLRNSIDVATFRPSGHNSGRPASPVLQRLPVRPPTKRAITPHMTGDSLANAIVASSLASSRAASPLKNPPPVPAPRRHKHTFFSPHQEPHHKKTPSPVRGLKRHTMRKAPQSDEENDSSRRRGHKHLVKKHPHKHHEGDRKRWRDEITERERKRYLAVWASNKGIHTNNARINYDALLDSPGGDLEAEVVCNLVVRDVFSRSRLGDDVLGEVYDLVNHDNTGGLSRDEFVVGLWLIDQRLKGRKLPIKVSPSVWESVVGRGAWKVPRKRR